MNKYQSIISAIISAICIFVLPYVNRHGFVIDEATASSIIIGIVGVIAFLWSCWKNHNITDAAYEAQLIMKELKEGEPCDYEDIEEEDTEEDAEISDEEIEEGDK